MQRFEDKENLTQIHNKANIREIEERIARENAEKFWKEKAIKDAEYKRIQDEIASKAKGTVTAHQVAGAGNKFQIIDYSNSNYHNDIIVKLDLKNNPSSNGYAAADNEMFERKEQMLNT